VGQKERRKMEERCVIGEEKEESVGQEESGKKCGEE
jgi:hypothetical protein